MRRIVTYFFVLMSGLFLMACGGQEAEETVGNPGTTEEASGEKVAKEPLDMVLLVAGLGDMSFSDSAHAGIQSAQEKYSDQIETEVIEFGYDFSVLESYLLDAADQYDVIIAPSQFVDFVVAHAQTYPEVSFWLYGTTFPYEEGEFENVYAMNYRSNEASFLAGYLASSKSDTGTLGFLGGMDNNVINDFLYGYIQGAQEADAESNVITSYVGSFDDTAKGKELSLAMYNNEASTIFNVAGPVGLGLAEAAIEVGGEAEMVGVDSDQAAFFKAQGRDELAEVVATSVLTNVGESIQRAIELELAGELVYGETDSLGLAEDAVGLAKNAHYEAAYSDELKTEIEVIEQKIIAGDIVVASVYDLPEGITAVRDEVAP